MLKMFFLNKHSTAAGHLALPGQMQVGRGARWKHADIAYGFKKSDKTHLGGRTKWIRIHDMDSSTTPRGFKGVLFGGFKEQYLKASKKHSFVSNRFLNVFKTIATSFLLGQEQLGCGGIDLAMLHWSMRQANVVMWNYAPWPTFHWWWRLAVAKKNPWKNKAFHPKMHGFTIVWKKHTPKKKADLMVFDVCRDMHLLRRMSQRLLGSPKNSA